MVTESRYWKDDLLKQAAKLRRLLTLRRWRSETFARLEKTMLLGFYSIRKLIEATKLTDDIRSRELTLTAYLWLGKNVTRMNWWHFWELYDMEHPQNVTRDVLFMCHQFVHSYVFVPSFTEQREFEGIMVCSDRERNSRLYLVPIQTIIDLFESVGSNYPINAVYTYNPVRRDYDFTSTVTGVLGSGQVTVRDSL
jgi:hypothetical protein